ncbi:MAG: paraquat-inducible protein A [Campylobacterota bacterium]|nr:paraquat-inducible protein A [Campylobacterota bacterium]
MKIKNEDELDNLIICHKCFTLHEEIALKDGSKACCNKCNNVLYRYDSKLINHGLALSITGFIFFILANLFPVIQIDILGSEQFITIPKTIISLFENSFYIVGAICAFLIFIFPLMIFSINMLLFLLLKIERGKVLTKELLVLLAHITPWSMADIFFISLLVSLVKLVAFGQIHIGVSFWALMIFVLIDIYITKFIKISEIWMLRKRIFLQKDNH